MIDIVFSDSARGSLLMAADVRKGNDVYGLELGLSVGDISGEILGEARRKVLYELCHFSPEVPGITRQIEEKIQRDEDGVQAVLSRAAAGEAVRLWYSGQPDELCGCCWLLAKLNGLKGKHGTVYAVGLPQYKERADGVIVFWNGWGEVSPEEWGGFLSCEQTVPPVAFSVAFGRWLKLTQENAPLRAVVSGRLVSVPANFYDSFLRRGLDSMPEEFSEAVLIGKMMGYELGVSDGWWAKRVETMVEAGELAAVTSAEKGDPLYRRTLRKV